MKTQERIAIEAVAKRFLATWERGSNPHEAHFTVAGKRVAVQLATLTRRGTGHVHAVKPHLRFDKVVVRLIGRLQASLGGAVPDGMTVLVTVTAPIRLPSKTAGSIEDAISARLARKSTGRDEKATIHGNRVQIRFLKHDSPRMPRVLGFVHNPDSDGRLLLDMARDLLELVTGAAGTRRQKRDGDRWLVATSDKSSSCLEAYRYIYSQLGLATGFVKIVLVFADGRVGVLTE